jgi:iron complex transport system ATP-binding protein
VHFGYGERRIFDGLDLEVPRGQLLGLIGPNGSGKSTLVRLCLGLLPPTGGRIEIDGRAVDDWSRRELARVVAAVPQEEALEFPFTVEEVVRMGRIPHLSGFGFEGASDRAAAAEAMRETGVTELAARPLHTLSGGERKRVLLARALAQEPQVLILDEPAASLDIHHQIAIFELLAERHKRGVTVIVVVHDLNLAAAYCERLLLLSANAPPFAGTVEEVLTYRRVRDTFGVDVYVGVNEVTGHRYLIPMRPPG